ncbi:hypothetical protein [Paludibaculum fermentans]|uniref:Uncharacterized protein n=1 Tax=Paludibaculum fermentans TaxID=1473598 RepID=A0A7S7NK42_PALFE|nr:hypothetical protein [Paludibaculum fermentans]QOY85062.1 hypothetical protein IRI77_19645 [Paludibaculum fermentans]
MNSDTFYFALACFALLCYAYLLHLILKGPIRPYVALFIDLIVLFLTNVAELALYGADIYPKVFYIDDMFRQAIVFILVISLVYYALTSKGDKRSLGRWLIIGATLLAAIFISYALLHSTNGFIRPMTNAVRNLSVTAMVMNLILWMLLLSSRTLDRRLLTVTSGLGVQMAGEAIGQSLRLMAKSLIPFSNFVLIASHFLCLAIWISAFRQKPRPAAPSAPSRP